MMAELQVLAADMGGRLKMPELRWKYAWLKPIVGWKVAKRAQSVLPELKGSLLKCWDKAMSDLESTNANNSD